MNKNKLRQELNNLEELKSFHWFVERAIQNDDDIKIKVKTKRYSMFFDEFIIGVKKINVGSKILLEVLDELINKKELQIDNELKGSDD
jgi:hypothetical protein